MPERKKIILNSSYNKIIHSYEIGVDEAGRGPMLGRVYSAAVILPKDDSYKHELMKDSKRFTSDKKIREAERYIKENAIAWAVAYCTEQEIDNTNILKATHSAMHKAIKSVIAKTSADNKDYLLLIDGRDFKPLVSFKDDKLQQTPFVCIEGGDNKYTAIAAASILAKVARDDYIEELCRDNPELIEKYNIIKNKGYGTKEHMDGIEKYGISIFHRKTFGVCKKFT